MSLLANIAENERVRGIIRSLGLRSHARKLYYRWKRPPDGILRTTAAGISARFNAGSYLELIHFSQSDGFRGERDSLESFLSFIRKGDVVLDAGANYGLYTVYSAIAVGNHGKVISFEPGSRSFSSLLGNVVLNGVGNVHAFQKALSDRDATERLYMFGDDPSRCSMSDCKEYRVTRWEDIDAVEGDGFLRSNGLPWPNVVKIDVEGSEWAALHGLQRTIAGPQCRLVFCEIHPHLLPKGVTPRDVVDFLESLGFGRTKDATRGREVHVFCQKL